jgi:hypothetical protein
VLLTDHSGAAAGRLALGGVLRLRDGSAEAAAPHPARRRAGTLTIRAVHPNGRAFERVVAEAASDTLLRALLAEGWHVVDVRR